MPLNNASPRKTNNLTSALMVAGLVAAGVVVGINNSSQPANTQAEIMVADVQQVAPLAQTSCAICGTWLDENGKEITFKDHGSVIGAGIRSITKYTDTLYYSVNGNILEMGGDAVWDIKFQIAGDTLTGTYTLAGTQDGTMNDPLLYNHKVKWQREGTTASSTPSKNSSTPSATPKSATLAPKNETNAAASIVGSWKITNSPWGSGDIWTFNKDGSFSGYCDQDAVDERWTYSDPDWPTAKLMIKGGSIGGYGGSLIPCYGSTHNDLAFSDYQVKDDTLLLILMYYDYEFGSFQIKLTRIPTQTPTPSTSASAPSGTSVNQKAVEAAVDRYQTAFIKAVQKYDFSTLAAALDSNGPIYAQQKSLIADYQKRGIKEELIGYGVTGTSAQNDGSVKVTVIEEYNIKVGTKPWKNRSFESVYLVRNTISGYKVSELISQKNI